MTLGAEALVELLGEGAEDHRLTHLLGGSVARPRS